MLKTPVTLAPLPFAIAGALIGLCTLMLPGMAALNSPLQLIMEFILAASLIAYLSLGKPTSHTTRLLCTALGFVCATLTISIV
jgi:thiamine transporter ThiT